MKQATISADVISYTSLPDTEKRKLESGIKDLLARLSIQYAGEHFYGRLVQGDYVECALSEPGPALRIALILKCFVKSFPVKANGSKAKRLKYFTEHGLRLAVAIAPLSLIDPENQLIDGEAIYLSGRAIKNSSTSDKQKIIIKNTMFFCGTNEAEQETYSTIFSLLDTILSRASAKQSEVIFYKLMGLNEKEIAQKLDKYQSTISQHSTSAGWTSIEKAIDYFEKSIMP